ncbi:MAG TPA: agmatinase [Stellaceae bacterium]|nr:agmatinase [Stellaceae bacterium]
MSATPTYALRPSFLGLERASQDAAIAVAGIPWDFGTSNRPGARFGPAAIRQASRMLGTDDHPWAGRAAAALDIADIGDFGIVHGDIAGTLAAIEKAAAPLSHLVALGGDHSITLPLLRALARKTGPLGLVHFDAHVDTWPESFGLVWGHGSPFYHAIEEGLVEPRRMVQIGIRSPVEASVNEWTIGKGVTIVTAEEVHESAPASVAEKVRRTVGEGPLYLSFDIDALDPAFAPGTGTPEVGGLATWQARAILRRLRGLAFAGMDVVEVAPAYDAAEITALAAATIAWDYIALLAPNRGVGATEGMP